MNLDDYLSSNKKELLSLFGQAHAARILETFINDNKKEDEEFLKDCCLDAVLAFKYMDSDLDYPVDNAKLKLVDQGFDPPNIPKKKKYIIPDTTM